MILKIYLKILCVPRVFKIFSHAQCKIKDYKNLIRKKAQVLFFFPLALKETRVETLSQKIKIFLI